MMVGRPRPCHGLRPPRRRRCRERAASPSARAAAPSRNPETPQELFYGVYRRDADRCLDALITMGVLVGAAAPRASPTLCSGLLRPVFVFTALSFLTPWPVSQASPEPIGGPCSERGWDRSPTHSPTQPPPRCPPATAWPCAAPPSSSSTPFQSASRRSGASASSRWVSPCVFV